MYALSLSASSAVNAEFTLHSLFSLAPLEENEKLIFPGTNSENEGGKATSLSR